MLPVIGAIRPWAEATVTAINRHRMHVPLARDTAIVVDGEWSFERWDHPELIPETAISGPAPERTVTVPGNWTLQGTVDRPHYTNVQMPFADTPPTVPEMCPTAVYRRRVEFPGPWSGQRIFVRVEGAESVHAVYLDGHFVGYGTDSRLPSEYELTDHLRDRHDGGHDLAIVVARYSAQSYLEDQDQWWMAGLHRSVVIEARPTVHLHDVVCQADVDPAADHGDLEIATEVDIAPGSTLGQGWSTRVTLFDPDGHPHAEPTVSAVPHRAHATNRFDGHRARHHCRVDGVRRWSAETPALYRVEVELLDPTGRVVDRVGTRCGFRRVEVRDRQLLVNGAPVWIFGVNRHEHHPDRGKAIDEADMRADLETMRAHNIVAVRTAHYPNHHRFYELCDELGMYVVDEANLEGHAFNTSICADERYRSSFVERGARMVQRDRNHPCVIVWSLGNETGYGPNHDALAGWIRRVDPGRPLHYEGAIFHGDHHDPTGALPLDVGDANRGAAFDPADANPNWVAGGRHASDLVCPMYPPIAAIEKYGADGLGDRPLIMCEYSHAMGNSNGSLAHYWDVITSTAGLQGGFIWEWKDHALRSPDGSGRLLHGGDIGTEPNDGNFVADGLVGADGDPHPGLHEVAWVYRPVTLEVLTGVAGSCGPNTIRISNRRSFTGLEDLEAHWELLIDGDRAADGFLEVPAVDPHSTTEIPLPDAAANALAAAADGHGADGVEAIFSVRWQHRTATWFAPAGHRTAWDQTTLSTRHGPPASPLTRIADPEALSEALVVPPAPTIWRAPVDNDGFKLMPELWKSIGVGGRALGRWIAAGVDRIPATELIEHSASISVIDGGELHSHRIVIPDQLADPGRVGVRFAIQRRFDHLRWYGRGPGENYPDRNRGSMIGVWNSGVDALPYLIPQEHGLRTDTRWMACSDPAGGQTLWVRAIDPAALHLSVVEHSAEELFAAANAADLGPSDSLWVHIDIAHRGLGTASCGPGVEPHHRIGPGVYEFAFWIGVTSEDTSP